MDLAFPGVSHDFITTLSVTRRSTVFKHASEVAKCHINADRRLLSEKIAAIKGTDFRSIFLQTTRHFFSDQNENVSITYWPIAEKLYENPAQPMQPSWGQSPQQHYNPKYYKKRGFLGMLFSS